MAFKFTPLNIPDVLLIQADKFSDDRGYFLEAYKKSEYENQIPTNFSQDNFSFSKKDVLRGLHYQAAPYSQGKLVRVLQGTIWDVAVDLRPSAKTFKQWVARELSEENGLTLYIPEGFAHGFVVTSPEARVYYKTTKEYNREFERGIIWNDKTLNIAWPVTQPIVSEKDLLLPAFDQVELV